MAILAKRLTDNHGDVWILLYEEGLIKEPLTILKAFEAATLVKRIQNELGSEAIKVEIQPVEGL